MQELTKWLAEIERKAQEFYSRSSAYFRDNHDLARFLQKMEVDELLHLTSIRKVEEILETERAEMPSTVLPPEELQHRVREQFAAALEKIESGTLTEHELYECILRMELSEWNDYLIYILRSILKNRPDLQPTILEMQRHLTTLEYYFHSNDTLRGFYAEIVKIPKIWNHRLLVVDDDEPLRELLAATLGQSFFRVDTAANGEQALEMIGSRYYDVIISDMDMPRMGGKQLFHALVENNFFDKRMLLFMTAGTENVPFFEENGLTFIMKPFHLDALMQNLRKVIAGALRE